MSIYNSDFSGNSAYRGGAIFNSGTTTVVNSLFDANISVDDGSAINNTTGATLSITNSTFQNHTPSGRNANGGAIYSLGELTINTSKFINNTLSNNSGSNGSGGAILANGTTTINTTEFTSNQATDGGAISKGASTTLEITNSTFTSNSAVSHGGALYVGGGSVTINGSDFVGNTAQFGGAIYINTGTVTVNGSIFKGNSATNNGGGGAIYNKAGTLIVDGSKFIENTVTDTTTNYSGDGFAIAAEANTKNTIKNSLFERNQGFGDTSINAAVIFAQGSENIIENTIFNENIAPSAGGAIFNFGNTTISGSTFTNNASTTGDGGAIYQGVNGSVPSLTVNSSKFYGNSALNGGAINVFSGTLSIESSIFEANSGTGTGGAIFADGGVKLSINSSQFTNNSQVAGGAIYINMAVYADAELNPVSITSSVFKGNNSTGGSGGAIFALSDLKITDSTFGGENSADKNSASVDGGAIFAGAGLVISDSHFENNITEKCGGAIGFGKDGSTSTLQITNTMFKNNTAGTDAANKGGGALWISTSGGVEITNSVFDSNNGYLGGAIYNNQKSDITISNSVFKNNTAVFNGGAIFTGYNEANREYGTVTINDSSFIGNVCVNRGAAIFNDAKGTVIINNGVFRDNSAEGSGGVVNNFGGKLTLNVQEGKSMLFSGNNGKTYGTLITDQGGKTTINVAAGGSLIFEKNTAEKGAAISVWEQTGTNLTINGALGSLIEFNNNASTISGALLYNNNVSINADAIRFVGNTAAKGAAIYGGALNTLDINANRLEFINNSSTEDGGAIYLAQNAVLNLNNAYFKGNTAPKASAIYSSGTLTVSDSIFEQNISTNDLGAIYLTGESVATFVNSSFYNNKTEKGIWGAIGLNYATLNLIADNGISEFRGNSTSQGNIAINLYDRNSIVNLNAGNSGKILLYDKIWSSAGVANNTNYINVNKSGIKLADGSTDAPVDGEVYIGDQVLALNTTQTNLNLYNGTLTLGKETYLSNNLNLNLNGGTLNLINNEIGTVIVNDFSSAAGTKLNIDASMKSGTNGYGLSDSITANGTFAASGAITLNAINVLADGDAQYLKIFNNAPADFVINTGTTYTNGGFTYTFAQNAADKGVVEVTKGASTGTTGSLSTIGFVTAFQKDTSNRAFSATGDVKISTNLQTMAGTGVTMTIFGNKHNISSVNNTATNQYLIVSDKNVLNVHYVGSLNDDGSVKTSWNGFESNLAGALLAQQSGTINIHNSVFSNNSATSGSSGAMKAESSSYLNIYDSAFIKNSSVAGTGAIGYESASGVISGTLFEQNTASTNGGAVGVWSGSALTLVNSEFKNNSTQSGGYGGALYVAGSDAIVKNTVFTGNTAGKGGAIYAKDSNITIDNTTFQENTDSNGGAAIWFESTTGSTANISNSKFIANKGSAIYNQSGIMNISTSEFTDAKDVINLIYNKGTMNITDSLFQNNSSASDTKSSQMT